MDLRTIIIYFVVFSVIISCIIGIIYLLIQRSTFYRREQINDQGEDGEYFRELPYDGDIYCIFRSLTYRAKIDCMPNFINAALVKWYREDKVDFKYNEEENNISVIFKSGIKYDHKAEQMLYHTLKSFAGNDGELTYTDIMNSLKFNYSTYQYFSDNIINYIGDTIYKYNSNEEYKKIFGLKRFINDFSMIPELGTNEVYLRDKYIEFAILLNCADKIKEEFKNLVPFNINIFFTYVNSINSINDQLEENYQKNHPFN